MGLTDFVHLHCHSAYSLLEGTAKPQTLVGMAKKLKMPALALTDRNNLYGAVPFYIHCRKAGVKSIIGMEVDLDDGSSLVLLARNFDGYKNLCHLATTLRFNSDPEAFPPAGFDEDEEELLPWDRGVWGVPVFGFTPKPASTSPIIFSQRTQKEPCLPRELLLSGRHARGLIALSGGRHGLVNSLVAQGKTEQAARAAGMLLSAFGEGNFFIEIEAPGEHDREAITSLANLAASLNVPIVATNNVLYLNPEDAPTALALAAARKGVKRQGHVAEPPIQVVEGSLQGDTELQEEVGTERYFKSAEQMAQLFRDYPQAIANTLFIAEQCNVELPTNKPLFPAIKLRPNETPYSRLWKLCFAGATRRYRPLTEAVLSRLKHELEIIEALGFCTYFLVVYDIVHFAHSRDIPIMARGSAANSLVAHVLGITQVDPLENDLLFERFLNPSRAEFELPDVDLDLCWRRRDEVLHYVYERYGRDHVAIVGTHITFRLRSAWREMAKTLGIHPQRISRVAGRLPHLVSAEDVLARSDDLPELQEVVESYDDYQPDVSIDVKASPKFRDEKERAAFELCQAIEGLPRHAGMHCAGVVIASGPIADLVPLQKAARDPSMAITQYDKDAIESMGLVKMDLLGSRALTALVDAVRASGLAHGRGRGDVIQSLLAIPYDDERTYRMMAEGNTLGCFQLESPGMRGLLKWLRPRSLKDIAAAVSLFRPGPLEGGFLETFMRRHLGQEPVAYHHPSMEPILRETHGVILYQEQFLRLAHTLAGMSLGEAEKLRKELGKARSPEERTRLGNWFVAGAIEKGIDQLQAEKVWEIIAGYTGFGFCKAHACSYALTAYRSAYMKAHHPAEYMAAVINNQGGFYGPSVYLEDARRMSIELLLPDVNLSGAWCEAPQRARSIRLGLQFVKGLSEKTIAALVSERYNRGRFRSLFDLLARVEMSPGEITALVKVGACDSLGLDADAGVLSVEPLVGEFGEAIGASAVSALTRKQMMQLLPSILLVRKPGAKRMFNRNRMELSIEATGSDGLGVLGMQTLMSDFIHHSDRPRILGTTLLHIDVPNVGDYTGTEKLRLEQEVMGFTVSRNSMELYSGVSGVQNAIPGKELARYAGGEITVAGVIVAGRRHMSKSGEWMLFLTLQDATGLIEVVLFPEVYKESGVVLANGGYGPYVVRGQVQVSGKGRGIGVQPPSDLQLTDAVSMKMHPIVVASSVRPFAT